MRQHYQNPACTFSINLRLLGSMLRAVCEAVIPFFSHFLFVAFTRVMVILRISLSVDTTFMPHTIQFIFVGTYTIHQYTWFLFCFRLSIIELQYVWMQVLNKLALFPHRNDIIIFILNGGGALFYLILNGILPLPRY